MSQQILVEREQGLLSLRLNRADKMNALTRDMYAALADALEAAESDRSVRAVLIAGNAECFTAGNDIPDFLQHPPTGAEAVFRFMRALMEFSKPVLAAVAGPAVGIGTTLLLHCDQVFVSRGSKLKMPFVNLGLCPEFGSSFLVPRLLGHARAASLLMRGEGFTGEQAVAMGLANEALADGAAALQRAREWGWVCKDCRRRPGVEQAPAQGTLHRGTASGGGRRRTPVRRAVEFARGPRSPQCVHTTPSTGLLALRLTH
jgi:enoyl-CoA hydratase/carnithine racemase